MHRLIINFLRARPEGATPETMLRELGIRFRSVLDDALRDMHWRGVVRRSRPENGDVVYTLVEGA